MLAGGQGVGHEEITPGPRGERGVGAYQVEKKYSDILEGET